MRQGEADLPIVVDECGPVEHVHGEFETEHGLLCQLSPLRPVPVSALHLVMLLIFRPRKLLQPHLFSAQPCITRIFLPNRGSCYVGFRICFIASLHTAHITDNLASQDSSKQLCSKSFIAAAPERLLQKQPLEFEGNASV